MATGWGRSTWSSGPWGMTEVEITPSVGALALSGTAPIVLDGVIITPSVGALALAGVAPSLVRGKVITPSV